MKPLFDVIVVATMSSGKSTLINALIGTELLHSANEATTATITRIHDKDDLDYFLGDAYDHQGELVKKKHLVNPEMLKEWNSDPNIKTIDLVGNIKGIKNSAQELVIYDTPGPNNSQDDSHEALTMEIINDGNYGVILYVLNATQLGINDDRHLLEQIKKVRETDPHKEIIFVLNKIDCIDEERGESVADVVKNAENYLTNLGFAKPTIVPTSASAALLFRKAIHNQSFTRSERVMFKTSFDYIQNNRTFIDNAVVPQTAKKALLNLLSKQHSRRNININKVSYRVGELAQASIYSGVGLLAYLIQSRVDQLDAMYHQSK